MWPFKRDRSKRTRTVQGQGALANPLVLRQGGGVISANEDERYVWVRERIDALPWFGQEVDLPARGRPRHRGERLEIDDEARVLLSWLAGGSVRQVARRADVGHRTVYNVVRRVVYTGRPMSLMGKWHDLGLIACMVTPRCLKVPNSLWQTVVCLICHQEVASYDWDEPRYRAGETFRPDAEAQMAPGNARQCASATQGHLVLHFLLEGYPIPFGRAWPSILGTDAWSQIPQRTRDYVEAHRWARSVATRPEGACVVQELEPWRRWRRRLLAGDRHASPPLRERAPKAPE